MARTIRDDEASARCAEMTVGNIDSDALLSLGIQTIHQQGVINVFALCANSATVGSERAELIVGHLLAVMQ